MKKFLCILLSAILLLGLAIPASAADSKYEITNPYENINWNTVKAYKTALHTHTNASDGGITLRQSIERHAEADFDIVATTDHGTVNYSWDYKNPNEFIHGMLSLAGRSEGKLDYLGKEGTFSNGLSYTYSTAENGDDYLKISNGKTIMRIPYGIENNAVSVNAHVNSWFTDYHDNTVTTYLDAVRGVDEHGGVCVINHPGEYTKARSELHSEKAYNEKNPVYKYYTDKFADLLEKYDACIGIDMNSKGDVRTRFDRILWDNLLKRFSANGENVYGIASSDAHNLNVIDSGYTLVLADEMNSAAVRSALENGEFFAASHCLGNYDELLEIAASLKEYYGETAIFNKVNNAAKSIAERIKDIENGVLDADEEIFLTYSVLDDNGYCTAETHPIVTAIKVDDEADTITMNTENALIIRWISDGKLIATQKADGTPFALSDYADKIGSYVRAEVFGEGGMLYVEPFILNAEENAGKSNVVGFYQDLGVFDFLLADFNNWWAIISRFFMNLFH